MSGEERTNPGRRPVRGTRLVAPVQVFLKAAKHHGVGGHRSRHYCECGAKKRAGVCPRCPA